MADVNFFDNFETQWAQSGNLESISEDQYKLGWAFIGATPPSVEQFNRVQQLSDQKTAWLFEQIKAAAGQFGVPLSADEDRSLLHVISRAMAAYGLGDNAVAVDDLNAIAKTGFYLGSASTANMPGALSGVVYHVQTPSNAATQLYLATAGGRLFTRSCENGTWTTWAERAGLNSPAFTGTPTVPTPAGSDNGTRIANTAFVKAITNLLAPLAGSSGQQFSAAAGTQSQHVANLGQFAAAFGSAGYVRVPVMVAGTLRALIIQWDYVQVSAVNGNFSAFAYPIRFPNACLAVVGNRQAPGSGDSLFAGRAGGDPSGQVLMQNFASSPEMGSYIAIGW